MNPILKQKIFENAFLYNEYPQMTQAKSELVAEVDQKQR